MVIIFVPEIIWRVSYEINHLRTGEMKSNEEWSSLLERQFIQLLCKKPKKIQDFNGVWTRDLAIPVWCPNQLSYEAFDVGNS